MSRREAIKQALSIFGLAAALLVVVSVSPLLAQTMNNSFGGLSENSDQPIDIESDTLTVYDAKKIAVFKGNVKAVQGTTILRAAQLDVHYVGGADKLTGQGGEAVPVANQEAKKKGGDAQSSIEKIEARGDVIITSADDQTTTSDWAIYDVPGQLVTVGGNVVLSQGRNVLKGNRLVIDLKTGESRFENTGNAATGGGRIRALFMPKGSDAKDRAAKKPAPGARGKRAPGVPPVVPPVVPPAAAAEFGESPPITPARR